MGEFRAAGRLAVSPSTDTTTDSHFVRASIDQLMPSAQQWEYKVIDVSQSWSPLKGMQTRSPEELLNELGSDGWELVDTLSEGGGNTQSLVLKRPC